MKNKILIVIILLFLAGCKNQEQVELKEEENKINIEQQYIDNNPITIGIYENDIKLVKDFYLNREINNEVIFSFYYTNEENLGNRKQKENWYKFFNKYTNIEDYKIGFHFSFYVDDKIMEKTILNPDTYAFNPYFYIYIYDDINQPDNTFYSHLEETDINENTIFSAIKIYLVDSYKITSPIKFTVFTYNDSSDFDDNNNYRGNSNYSININLI